MAVADSLQELKERIEAHLREQTGSAASVTELSRLPGGACQDNFRLQVSLESGALAGHRRLVLRSDARSSLPGSLGRREEFAVLRAARDAGTPTPQAWWLGKDIVRPGAFAYFLDWVDGEVIGRRVVRNPELAEARSR